MSAALLDTHALLWLIDDNPQLGSAATARITERGSELFFSYASVAQCLHADLTLLSQDTQLDAYGIRRVW